MHTRRGPGPPLPGRRTPGGVGGGGGRRLRDTAGRALPRGRRENAGNQSPLPLIHDSSPRERGKRRRAVPGAAGQRLIPARAGKTPSPRQCPATSSAHPRAGGENKPRGILASGTRAHPRAYGENGEHCAYPVEHPGSSPRVRGKRLQGPLGGLHAGLIPARAGKTRERGWQSPGHRAHPRACGENTTSTRSCWGTLGSSPRVRGKPDVRAPGGVEDGLIPTRAGKT